VLENLQPNQRYYSCNVNELLKTLEDADKKIFMDAVADEQKWTAYGLHAALKARGLKLNDKAINKHRQGECSC
jgi:hypothetical protein